MRRTECWPRLASVNRRRRDTADSAADSTASDGGCEYFSSRGRDKIAAYFANSIAKEAAMITDVRASKMFLLLHEGESAAGIARRLKMSEKTVRKYR